MKNSKKNWDRAYAGAKRPNAPLYHTAAFILRIYCRLAYNFHYDAGETADVGEPFVAIVNHASNVEFITASIALYPRKTNILVSTYYFSNPLLGGLLRVMGAIPKLQFTADVAAVRSMLEIVRNGHNVMLFPEGQASPSGSCCYIQPSIVKLLRKLNVPVVAVNVSGAHLTHPKWRASRSRGRVVAKTSLLFTPEQLRAASDDEIYSRVVQALDYNDYEYARKNNVVYRSRRRAEGLEKILYLCPWCGSEFSLKTRGDSIYCEKCGGRAVMDAHCSFDASDGVTPADADKWYRLQYAELEKHIDEAFSLETECAIGRQRYGSYGYKKLGRGRLTLDIDGIRYIGSYEGQQTELFFSCRNRSEMASSAGNSFDISERGGSVVFFPDVGAKTAKFVLTNEIFHSIRRNRNV